MATPLVLVVHCACSSDAIRQAPIVTAHAASGVLGSRRPRRSVTFVTCDMFRNAVFGHAPSIEEAGGLVKDACRFKDWSPRARVEGNSSRGDRIDDGYGWRAECRWGSL